MPTFSFPSSPATTLEETLLHLSPTLKTSLKQGFSFLSKLPEQKYDELLAVVQEIISVRSLNSAGLEKIATKLGLSKNAVSNLVPSVATVISILSGNEEKAEQFVQTAIKEKLVEESDRSALLKFIETTVRQRGSLERTLEQATISSRTLPSFSNLSTSIDVRLAFKDGKIKIAVPVAVLHLDTDSDQEIWLQMNIGQVEKVIEELQETLRHLQEAEQWAEKNILSK